MVGAELGAGSRDEPSITAGLLARTRAHVPVEPLAFALALGFQLAPQLAGPATTINLRLEYNAAAPLAEQQSDVLRAICAWELARLGLPVTEQDVASLARSLV